MALPTYVDASAAGDNVVVAGVAGKRIAVTAFLLLPASAVTFTFKSGTAAAGSNATIWGGVAVGGSGQPLALPGGHNPNYWMVTAADGDDLNLSLSDDVQVMGVLNWQYIQC